NPAYVYDLIKDREDIDFKFLLFSDPNGHSKMKNIREFMHLYATSKVVIVDDYFRLLNVVDKREGVKLFQLWHACGAFKTFGFTRLGKKGGPKQTDVNHRMYDYAIVSSKEIEKHYAEGFGLSDECVVATGIPRTDIFMQEEYGQNVRKAFYEKHPELKDKKILLFAPTFRGNGQMSAFYPLEAFNPEKVYESLGEEYAIIIKLHPFCKERFEIDEKYKDFIIDLSEEDELNDLLFVTDLLVTDYSSVVFEASLLNIPMLFYAYDLYEYISSRDFYYDFEGFVPGKIVFSENELINSIKEKDFEEEKVDGFKNKFFDSLDGKSSQRVADLIVNQLDI
ncbi:MAG: CDP-glycerol glycerophosphotransferase family protein, partial [Eubacterium sp.]|nr:CDP-glycerol glycerophosphotransferase family protein [Eubacterium sp.]